MADNTPELQNPTSFKRSLLCNPIPMDVVVQLPDGSFKSCGGGILTDEMIVEDMTEETDKEKLPVLHAGKSYPGGVVIFGKAEYTREELDDAFERIRVFGYKVADMRPEWSKFANIAPAITASRTLRKANEYTVPTHVVNNLSHVEYLEALNFIRSLWRDMDAIWREEFGDPVPDMPSIAPDIDSAKADSTEDQINKALRFARKWCAARIAAPPSESRNEVRDKEVYELYLAKYCAKEIMKMWNENHEPNERIKKVGHIYTIINRMKQRREQEQRRNA